MTVSASNPISNRIVVFGLCLFSVVLTGCWTGHLMESGRLHESVLTYERVGIEADVVYVDYVAEIAKKNAQKGPVPIRKERRGATFALEALRQSPPHRVEVFPLRSIQAGAGLGQSLPLSQSHPERASQSIVDAATRSVRHVQKNASPLIARIDEEGGHHVRFDLCPEDGEPCVGRFYSAALYEDSIAWWVYPALPFTLAFDLVLLPIQLFTLPPLIALSD